MVKLVFKILLKAAYGCLRMTPSIPFKAVTREIVDAIHTSGLLEVQVKLFLVF